MKYPKHIKHDGHLYVAAQEIKFRLGNERFIHFTTADVGAEILRTNTILPNPATGEVLAVSLTYGEFDEELLLPEEISSHNEPAVAVIFTTSTIPVYGTPTKVVWDQPVKIENAQVMAAEHGANRIFDAPGSFPVETVVQYVP